MDYSYNYSMDSIPPGLMFVNLLVAVFYLFCMWKLFTKAGQAGWKCLIPIYNYYIMLKIGGKPGWWLLLMLIPFVNIVIAFMMLAAFLRAYGRFGAGPVLLMIFFGIFYLPHLAFSSSVQYIGAQPAYGSPNNPGYGPQYGQQYPPQGQYPQQQYPQQPQYPQQQYPQQQYPQQQYPPQQYPPQQYPPQGQYPQQPQYPPQPVPPQGQNPQAPYPQQPQYPPQPPYPPQNNLPPQ